MHTAGTVLLMCGVVIILEMAHTELGTQTRMGESAGEGGLTLQLGRMGQHNATTVIRPQRHSGEKTTKERPFVMRVASTTNCMVLLDLYP